MFEKSCWKKNLIRNKILFSKNITFENIFQNSKFFVSKIKNVRKHSCSKHNILVRIDVESKIIKHWQILRS